MYPESKKERKEESVKIDEAAEIGLNRRFFSLDSIFTSLNANEAKETNDFRILASYRMNTGKLWK